MVREHSSNHGVPGGKKGLPPWSGSAENSTRSLRELARRSSTNRGDGYCLQHSDAGAHGKHRPALRPGRNKRVGLRCPGDPGVPKPNTGGPAPGLRRNRGWCFQREELLKLSAPISRRLTQRIVKRIEKQNRAGPHRLFSRQLTRHDKTEDVPGTIPRE